MYWFYCTKEFKDMSVKDWLDNKKWFDVKLLVDINAGDYTREMQSDSYGKHIKAVLQ